MDRGGDRHGRARNGAIRERPGGGTVLARFAAALPGSRPIVIDITNHLWAPAAYTRHAAAQLGGVSQSCSTTEGAEFIADLTKADLAILLRESVRIANRLRGDIRCAGAHEEAAVLIGALALREAASAFSDTRRLLSRMTAHLAVAQALDGGSSRPAGKLADALLLTLVGRQLSALDLLAGWNIGTSGMAAWSRALRLRNTTDWRPARALESATRLERLELVSAIEYAIGGKHSLDLAREIDDGTDSQVTRLLLQRTGSVEIGNRYGADGMNRELREAAELMEAFGRSIETGDVPALVRELNTQPGASPISGSRDSVWPIDYGTWMAASQRHIVMTAVAVHWHLYAALGLPEDAREFRQGFGREFGSLTLYPLAQRFMEDSEDEYASALRGRSRSCRPGRTW